MHKKNQILRLTVEDLNNLGFGVAHADGKAVFIADAVDGDVIDARIISVKNTYSVARVEKLVTPSPHREDSFCHVRGCGGCAYRAVSYAHELLRKENQKQKPILKLKYFFSLLQTLILMTIIS